MTSYPNTGSKTLSHAHRRILFEELGIDPRVCAERGTYSARRGADVPQTSGWLPKKPGIVFRVHTLDGEVFPRLRLENPGRLPKYMQPKGHSNRLDIHPRQHKRIRQPGGMRYVTEGEKKVDAGVSRGLLMVGLSGVWNGQKDKELIPDWFLLPLAGEHYSILFDSDIETNPDVQMAADRQARLLQEQGAEVFITLLPPAQDGSKQGLDDFFAAGGTVKELDLLTKPYDDGLVERVRLTRDEKLRAAIDYLWHKWWATEWKGQGGHTDRDLALKIIEAARKHGKLVGDDLRVVKAWGPLMVEAKISSSRTMGKSIARLEDMEFLKRDNEGRKADKPGTFVFHSVVRASVKQYGGKATPLEATKVLGREGAPGTLHLRAPRLRWSKPKYTPRRGLVLGTRRVRQSPKPEPRDRIERLGKVRCAILDVLDKEGPMEINELAAALHRRRARDLRRRNLPMLEDAGIVTVEGNTVSLTDNWLEALEHQRELGKEIEAEDLARERYKEKSRAFHSRDKEPTSKPSTAGLEAIQASREKRRENLSGWVEKSDTVVSELSSLAVAVWDYLEAHPFDARQPAGWIGSTLWAYEVYPGKPTPAETKAAIEELGGAKYLDSLFRRGRSAA